MDVKHILYLYDEVAYNQYQATSFLKNFKDIHYPVYYRNPTIQTWEKYANNILKKYSGKISSAGYQFRFDYEEGMIAFLLEYS